MSLIEQAVEDAIEAAYWNFDARRKGYAEWKPNPQSERDAFKAEARKLVKGYFALPRETELAEARKDAELWRELGLPMLAALDSRPPTEREWKDIGAKAKMLRAALAKETGG